jgi:ABC-type transport system involved in cytochrome bd biosynthesis fused ATPase/permease subunit
LSDINIKFSRSELTIVIGKTGAGKSSLLHAIMGEMRVNPSNKYNNNIEKTVDIYGSIGYVSQSPWILNSTVKKNILLNKPENQDKLQKVLT